jgi:hypothetical protein
MVVDPRLYLAAEAGAFTLALKVTVSIRIAMRERDE